MLGLRLDARRDRQSPGRGWEIEAAQETADAIENAQHKSDALRAIAKALAEAGEFDAAKETAGVIEGAYWKADALREIAKAQAEADLLVESISTSEMILASREEHIPEIASIIAQKNRSIFKKLLIPCAHYLTASYRICRILVLTYPGKAYEIARIVREIN
ncbi:MAG: hypothetical protein IPG76_22480 [Acidobacteria bacterium]|nr:hypothetical protein [Acidobacteriota bacterium]